MGRIPQVLGNAALAASVLAGGVSLLGAGGAQAGAVLCPPGGTIPPEGIFTAKVLVSPADPATCALSSPVGSNPLIATLDTDFTPNPVGPKEGYVVYQIDSQKAFLAARIDSDFDTITGSVRKEIFTDIGLTNKIWDYTSTNGIPNPAPPQQFIPLLDQTKTTLYVKDSYKVEAGGQLDNFTNTFLTPGPLPILGAGAAFGFSRKLRSRIKAARLS